MIERDARSAPGKSHAGAAEFLGGAARARDIATIRLPDIPRVAFAGRSNVGKSSLLNALAGVKVARVSAEPGKTRELNFFRWKKWVLVDLPGYGYAKVSHGARGQWGKEITAWLRSGERPGLVVSLVDGRHGFQPLDLELLAFLRGEGIPCIVAFTKMDKWKSANRRREAERQFSADCAARGVADFVFVSSTAKGGVAPLASVLHRFARPE